MSAPPCPADGPRGSRRPRGAARGPLALVPIVALLLVSGALPNSRTLPACDAPDVRERLASVIEEIPALAGRNARLLGIDAPRARGHAGRAPLRACQGRLVTSVGSGAIEYSIRRTRSGALAVRPELFQGGWRRELVPTDG